MLKTYELACNLDIMCSPRITLSKGRYSTADPKTQMVLDRYPSVTLISTEPEPVASKLTPEAAAALYGIAPGQPAVTNAVGLQMKEKQPPTSTRVTEG